METQQFWVVEEAGDWCVRAKNPHSQHGWETVKRTRSRDLAVAWAADRNARAMGLQAPQRRTPTAAEARAAFDGLGATRIASRWVHHKNQHTD